MTTTADTIVVRPDLVHRRVWMGRRPVWVIKDPVSGEFYYYGDREHQILSTADGRRVDETLIQCRELPGLDALTQTQLTRFLNDAAQKRLIHMAGRTLPPQSRPNKRWWRHPLAMRLPGVSPAWFLDRLVPIAAPLLSPTAVIISLILMLAALFTIITQLDTWTGDVTSAALRLASPAGVLLLMIVIAAAKVVHELAHALVCRRLGGQVREMGVMLLVGIPCLYCDVSDAWLFDRRWKRIAVSAAGIWAELTLAAIAALVWVWTVDGPLKDVCVTLTVVCSVSTVLFNGNPLLRYDGYYILSDCVGVPNLAHQSTALLRSAMQRWLWGTPMPPSVPSLVGTASGRIGQSLVALYGMLSGTYRFFVLTIILWWLYRGAHRLGIGAPIGMLLLATVLWFVMRRFAALAKPPQSASSGRYAWPRAAVRGLVIAGPLLAAAMIPLPRHLAVPMTIEATGTQKLFVTTAGRVMQQTEEGQQVRQGDPIVVLRNPEIERRLLEFETDCDSLRARIDNVRKQRGMQTNLSHRIPTLEKALADAEKQLELEHEKSSDLTIRAPRDGVVFAAHARMFDRGDDRTARFWDGTPIDPINHEAWLEQGTVIGMIGDQGQREAILSVPQQDIELLRVGHPVTMLIASLPRGSINGTVSEVSISPAPVEDTGLPETPMYQVRVRIDSDAIPLPVRLRGQARITIDRASLIHRIGRFLAGAFTQLS